MLPADRRHSRKRKAGIASPPLSSSSTTSTMAAAAETTSTMAAAAETASTMAKPTTEAASMTATTEASAMADSAESAARRKAAGMAATGKTATPLKGLISAKGARSVKAACRRSRGSPHGGTAPGRAFGGKGTDAVRACSVCRIM